MANVSERIDKLSDEAAGLRKEVKELKETLQEQNELIINLLTKQNLLLEQASVAPPSLEPNATEVMYGKNITQILRRFPLQDIEDLGEYEAELNDNNMQQNINIVQHLVAPHGLVKNIVHVISDKIIMDVNVDGHHNKKRLLDYKKFIEVLYSACYTDGYTKKDFLNDLRRALRNSKNRLHKNNCVARQKMSERFIVTELNMDIVKTEEDVDFE
ncbi:uncharacterized protein LOC131801624 isoform X1 [Musca domestica]|uniref:Uncharacterized protein LOC131801624 isoform X1 n=1 Tax=Musca domestica TaxID=7370 RepID=A0ABM3USG3_MUSDO|nr:uncharacterized protein LOC131801624 isoform X1 [Musca domestica]